MASLPKWLEQNPSEFPQPPVRTKLQELPYGQLSWENFERLCLRLARTDSDIEECRFYGTPGSAQKGIDLCARKKEGQKRTVYQCKRVRDFGAQKIANAVKKFLEDDWATRSDVFVLCTQERLSAPKRLEEIERQRAKLSAKGISLVLWDSDELNLRLKDHPRIVDDFFDRPWVEAFCGTVVTNALTGRLGGRRAATVREQLAQLYSHLFAVIDSGLRLPSRQPAAIKLQQRYVIPDIINSNDAYGRIGLSTESAGDDKPYPGGESGDYRQAIESWLRDKKQALILGAPGSGKSALLRVIALELLSTDPPLIDFDASQRSYIPIWIPFGFWTSLIAENVTLQYSVEDVLRRWLHSESIDHLWPDLHDALNDERVLLLVDGLDEYRSEHAAHIAVKQLQVFVSRRSCPVISTSRPGAFQQLVVPSDWSVGTLADLSILQQRCFIEKWMSELVLTPLGVDKALQIKSQVDQLQSQIERTAGIRALAGNPLLLAILTYLSSAGASLPQNRFEAYAQMVNHLIVEHPRERNISANIVKPITELTNDQIRWLLALLAYQITKVNPEGSIAKNEAVSVVGRAIKAEAAEGAPYQLTDSPTHIAQRLIQMPVAGLGLVIDKSQHTYGFSHRAFQEHLCAVHLFSLSTTEQIQHIEEHGADPQWHDIIAGLVYMHDESTVVDGLISALQSQNVTGIVKFAVDRVLCEIITGPPRCSFDVRVELFKRFADAVETESWMPHRIALLRLLVNSHAASNLRELVRDRLNRWYPLRQGWRRTLYSTLGDVYGLRAVKDYLLKGLLDESTYNRDAAAQSIAELSHKHPELIFDLKEFLKRPRTVSCLIGVSETILLGWPHDDYWAELESPLRSSLSIDLRLIAIRGRVITGRHGEDEKQELLWLITNSGPFRWRESDAVVDTVLAGWPNDPLIRDRAIDGLWRGLPGDDRIYSGAALKLLIKGFSHDLKATEALCKLVSTDHQRYFDHHEIWRLISERYSGDTAMINAADQWIERQGSHNYPEVSYAARLGWTELAKKKLIENLVGIFAFWSAEALLDGWGMSDPEVSESLLDFVHSDDPSSIGHVLPRIILDRQQCFEKLISLLEPQACRDPGRVLAGLAQIATKTERNRVIELALASTHQRRPVGFRDRLVRELFQHFADDPRVERLALEEMSKRDGDYSSVIKAFANQPIVIEKAVQLINPLPLDLRKEIVSFLEQTARSDKDCFRRLSEYDLEANPTLKTRAAIAYCTALPSHDCPINPVIQSLSETFSEGGPDFESRWQAAFCGLIALEKPEQVLKARADHQRPIPITFRSGLERNEAFILFVLSHWTKLRTILADQFEKLFFYEHQSLSSSLDWWDDLADYVDKFPSVRDELLDLIEQSGSSPLPSNLLLFLGRTRPRSNLLLRHCLNVIEYDGPQMYGWKTGDIAAYLLGRDFANDELTVNRLLRNEHDGEQSDNILLALCEISPHSTPVKSAFSVLRDEWTQANRPSITSLLEMHLACLHASVGDLTQAVGSFIAFPQEEFEYHAGAFLRPLVKRLTHDGNLRDSFKATVQITNNPSVACSFAKLLMIAAGIDVELKEWAVKQTTSPATAAASVAVALDLTSGLFTTPWHVGAEILGGV